MQVYKPLEGLIVAALVATVAETVVPPIAAVPVDTVRAVVRAGISLTYVVATAIVVFTGKRRYMKERLWKAESTGAHGTSPQCMMCAGGSLVVGAWWRAQ